MLRVQRQFIARRRPQDKEPYWSDLRIDGSGTLFRIAEKHNDGGEPNKTMPASSPKKTPASSEAILKLLAPDGYYTYLGIDKPVVARPLTSDGDPTNDTDNSSSSPSVVDEEQIKKNYRKLSLRHHPDRPTGDADTFRVLNRAQKVLLNPKLRQQYDLLGMDLDDDEEETDSEHPTNAARNTSDAGEDGDEGNSSGSSSMDNIMSQIAAATLATIFQVMVRTGKKVDSVAIHTYSAIIVSLHRLVCMEDAKQRLLLRCWLLFTLTRPHSHIFTSHDGVCVCSFGSFPTLTLSRLGLSGIFCLSIALRRCFGIIIDTER